MQVERVTRESYMGFSLTQLICNIHHFRSVYISHKESYPCLTPGGMGGGTGEGVEHWKYLRLVNARNVYTKLPINDKDFFYFFSCFINNSDNIWRSVEKLLLSPVLPVRKHTQKD